MNLYRQEWTVEGVLPFPIDMLRYDRCFPADEAQSAAITRTLNGYVGGHTQVRVARFWRGDMPKYPTADRWRAFGWDIIPNTMIETALAFWLVLLPALAWATPSSYSFTGELANGQSLSATWTVDLDSSLASV